jgi:hypothetical protein
MEMLSEPDPWAMSPSELERRLLETAEALLAQRGARCTLVPIPGRLPVRCIAIGELGQIRQMVRTENVYA